MPKVLEHMRETILHAARQALLTNGYDALTMRGVAKACGIAVGTMYNYFPAKELLAAAVMLEDWQEVLSSMHAQCDRSASVDAGLSAVYGAVARFYDEYRGVWAGYSFSASARMEFSARHNLLVRQLSDVIRPLLERFHAEASAAVGTFFAENILVCAGNSEMTFPAFLQIAGRIFAGGSEPPQASI